jgi:hypothetical protein
VICSQFRQSRGTAAECRLFPSATGWIHHCLTAIRRSIRESFIVNILKQDKRTYMYEIQYDLLEVCIDRPDRPVQS